MFIEYPQTQKGYKLIDPKSLKVIISRNVTFFENIMFFSQSTEVKQQPEQHKNVFYPWCGEDENLIVKKNETEELANQEPNVDIQHNIDNQPQNS